MGIEEVAKIFHVDMNTIITWISKLKMNVPTINNQFIFSEDDIKYISRNLDVAYQQNQSTSSTSINTLLKRLDQLELKIDQKADDVVSYQLNMQRKEIEELYLLIHKLQKQVDDILNQSSPIEDTTLIPIEQLSRKKSIKSKPMFKWL